MNRCHRPAARAATGRCPGDFGGWARGTVLPLQTPNVQQENQQKALIFRIVLIKARRAMHLVGIGTATPAARYTKAECLEAFRNSDWFGRLDARAHFVAQTVLQRDNGIEVRRLALDCLADVF